MINSVPPAPEDGGSFQIAAVSQCGIDKNKVTALYSDTNLCVYTTCAVVWAGYF